MPRDLLSLLGILLVLLLVLGACYLVTRWAGTGMSLRFGAAPASRQPLQYAHLPAGRYFVIGSSPSGLSLLAELTEEEGALWSPPSDVLDGNQYPGFGDILRKFREKK